MMMKKKHKTEEEEVKDNSTETADNKQNTDTTTEQDQQQENGNAPAGEAGQGTSTGQAEAGATDKTARELKETLAKLAEMQDKYIRLSAEFDNYRKRTLREKMDLSKFATEEILLRIIPLMDDFDRALKHMEDGTDCTAMKSGIDLIYTKFSEFLKQNGVKEIEALNGNFNVDIHEAVAKVPVSEEEKKGKVVDVVLKGYFLQDKVIRFSKVVVGE